MHLNPADNYFELFGIPPGFDVAPARIESKYRELQSLLHPDRYATAGAQEQRLAVQGAALVNQAYAVLTDDCSRAAYLLEIKGVEFKGEPDTVSDSEFLMEQMELREALEQSTAADLTRLERDADTRMSELSEHFKRAYAADDPDVARALVLKMKFIKKFRDEIGDKRRRAVGSDAG